MNLKPKGLAAGREAYLRAVRSGSDPSEVVKVIVIAYLGAPVEVLNPNDPRLSPVTKKLLTLRVGQHIDVVAQPLQSIRQRFKTVANLTQNLKIVFRCETQKNGKVRITRQPDGERYSRDPRKNPKAAELASLKVGESIIAKTLKSTRGVGQMGSNTKISARKILGNPYADWSVETTIKGVRLTRLKDNGDWDA